MLYIDDMLVCEFKSDQENETGNVERSWRSLYILCQVLLDWIIILPDQKRQSFKVLRESILEKDETEIQYLQRFAGKCVSFYLAIPSARLFSRGVNRAISLASKNSRKIDIYKELREELEYWRFLDDWTGFASWRSERHLQLALATDSSLYKWGAYMLYEGRSMEFGDFCDEKNRSPIHVKVAKVLLQSLNAVRENIFDARVDVYCDNLPVVKAWSNQGSRDRSLGKVLQEMFLLAKCVNIDLRLFHASSDKNPADKESRKLRLSDAKLAPAKWDFVQVKFCPDSTDLMALDSNVMTDVDGNSLKHVIPFPTVLSSGVNIFPQNLRLEDNSYVFPPFSLIFPVLKFCADTGVTGSTIVVPVLSPTPVWWPFSGNMW